MRLAFATCEELPDLDPDDRLAVGALGALGIEVQPIIWTGPDLSWDGIDACVLRSTWDYHRRFDEFSLWIAQASSHVPVINDPKIVEWNAHKFYLRDLHLRGVPVVESEWLESGDAVDLDALLRQRHWNDAVIKPVYGASAHGIVRVGERGVAIDVAQSHLATLLSEQDAIVQPFLPAIEHYHERALTFFGGSFSHAVTKAPFMHAYSSVRQRAERLPGASGEKPAQATPEEVAVAESALAVVPGNPVYARVDVVRDDEGAVRVLELEVIEPTLYLYAHPEAPARFARALRDALSSGVCA